MTGVAKEKLHRRFRRPWFRQKLEARVRCFKCKWATSAASYGKGCSSSALTASTNTNQSRVNYVFMVWPVWSNAFLPFGIKANGLPGPPSSDEDAEATEVMHMQDPPGPPWFGQQVEARASAWLGIHPHDSPCSPLGRVDVQCRRFASLEPSKRMAPRPTSRAQTGGEETRLIRARTMSGLDKRSVCSETPEKSTQILMFRSDRCRQSNWKMRQVSKT